MEKWTSVRRWCLSDIRSILARRASHRRVKSWESGCRWITIVCCFSSKSSEKPLPDVVPPRVAPSPTATPAAAASTSVAASSVKATPLYAPRPVGRPPTVTVIGSSAAIVYSNNTAPAVAPPPPPPVATTDNYIPDLNPAHNCQVGFRWHHCPSLRPWWRQLITDVSFFARLIGLFVFLISGSIKMWKCEELTE